MTKRNRKRVFGPYLNNDGTLTLILTLTITLTLSPFLQIRPNKRVRQCSRRNHNSSKESDNYQMQLVA